jgi:serine/threonine-protein kinase
MTEDPRLQPLIDKLLELQATPEEVCAACPELLGAVRARLKEVRRVAAQLDVLFPSSSAQPTPKPGVSDAITLPEIPGHEVEVLIGRGGMGVVFRARHVRLNRVVAVKLALAGDYMAPQERVRFQREAEAVAAIRHANIVQIHDIGDSHGRPYFTMEYVDGGSLAGKLSGTALPAREAAALIATIADAVHAAHQAGVVHRDLKPGNVLLTADGVPKIGDFGLALRTSDTTAITGAGMVLGTPEYMAPEQAESKPCGVGPAVDIHALGVILFEMLTGRVPFRGETPAGTMHHVLTKEAVSPSRYNAKVPRDLETICLKCLHKSPSGRYATAAALADDLRRFLNGEAIHARPEGRLERAVRQFRRRPGASLAFLAGAIAILALAATGIYLYLEKSGTERRQHANQVANEKAAEANLHEMVRFLETSSWDNARTALEQARARIDKNETPAAAELTQRIQQGERELSLARRLEAIRLARAARLGKKNAAASSDKAYEMVFAGEGLGSTDENPDVVADRIQKIAVRATLVAAVDDWAACCQDSGRQEWLLSVARRADTDTTGWRNRARNPAAWKSKPALVELAAHVPVERPSVPLLLNLAEHMRKVGADPIPLLKRVQLANADDFWANLGLAEAHMEKNNLVDAIRYYQSAIALRKDAAVVYGNLGLALALIGRLEDADEQLRQGSRFDPSAPALETLGIAGHRDDIIDRSKLPQDFRERVAWLHLMLANDLRDKGKLDDALQRYRQAIAIDPKLTSAQFGVRDILTKRGKLKEVRQAWHKAIEADPPDYDAWDGYAELCLFFGMDAEYGRVRRILLDRFSADDNPRRAELTGRACLLLPASTDELKDVEILVGRALASEKNGPNQFAKALLDYRQGRLESALEILTGEAAGVMGPCPKLIEAMILHKQGRPTEARKILATTIQSHDWRPEHADNRNGWIFHILRREAEMLVSKN